MPGSLIAVTGCFISCDPADEHPDGALLVVGAIVAVPATLVAASRVAGATGYLGRAALASGVTGAVLIAARTGRIPGVTTLVLVVLASLVWTDTIGPIAVALTAVALSVNPRRQRYSAT